MLTQNFSIGTGRLDGPFIEGKNVTVGGKDVEFDRPVDKQDFLSGACFGNGTAVLRQPSPALAASVPLARKKFVMPSMNLSTRTARPALQDANFSPAEVEDKGETPLPKAEESHWTANWCVSPRVLMDV